MQDNMLTTDADGVDEGEMATCLCVEGVRSERRVRGSIQFEARALPDRARERSVVFEAALPDGSTEVIEVSPEMALRMAAMAADAAQTVREAVGDV
jgi:hypothetical protein